MAVENLRQQLIAAAEKVKQDPAVIYSYVQIDTPYERDLVISEMPQVPALPTPQPVAVEPENADPVANLVDRVFDNLKRTEKSVRIIGTFARNSGNDMSIEQLVNETGLSKNDVCAWLAQTGKKVKCVTNPSRGTYKFDPDKI